jgi:ATP-dependent helicase Lhr and Lhr-like helicase
VPPPIQRIRSDDLLAAVFPEQVGCQENITGPLTIPDHPLTRQTLNDCLYEAMDIERLTEVLRRWESGEVRLHARDTTEPSPFAHEILNAKPYAYLDDAPLEERRTRAVSMRRTLPDNARDLGALDPEAIERVREEARPAPRDPDELHDVLLGLVLVRPADDWREWFDALAGAGRAAEVRADDGAWWCATEAVRAVRPLHPDAEIRPAVSLPAHLDGPAPEREVALLAAARGHMEYVGPATPAALAVLLGAGAGEMTSALARLEGEGVVLRGRFTPGVDDEEFCDRRLLARIHRYTLDRLRSEIEPVSAQDFMRYLLERHHIGGGRRLDGKRGLIEVVAQLQGFEAAASAWERDLLPVRVAAYDPRWLDDLCLAGDVAWARLSLRKNGNGNGRSSSPSRATPISLVLRRDLPWLLESVRGQQQPEAPAGVAGEVLDALRRHGALFFEDLVAATRQLPAQVEEALRDLVARGIVTGDGFQPLRHVMAPAAARQRSARRHARYGASRLSREPAAQGRWSLVQRIEREPLPSEEQAEAVAMQLLARYGVVFRDLVAREHFAVPWRDIVRALRRQEARGVVRGGRFVAGFIGEQYGLPEAVDGLRRVRRAERTDEITRISATDPLNLAGIITPGPRVPAMTGNSLVLRDGLPVAVEEGKKLKLRDGEAGESLRELLSRPRSAAAS